MWRRALLAAAALSYLICVLIMSGMQKEDLDVSMLRKLQRYDVNFDDINNERIRQQCTLRNSDFTSGDQQEFKDGFVSTTEYKTTITTEHPLSSASLNMDSIINYLKTREDIVKNFEQTTTTTTGKITSAHQEIVTPASERSEDRSKIDMDLLRRYIQLETQNKSFYKLRDNSKTTKHDTTINLKTNEKNSNMAYDVTFIDKLLRDYILKKQKSLTTHEYTTASSTRYTIDIRDIYKQIDKIIEKDSKIDEDKMIENDSAKDGKNNNKHNVITPIKIIPTTEKPPYPTEKRFFETFFKLLSEINQLKKTSARPFSTNNDNEHTEDNTEKDKITEPSQQNNAEKHEESATDKSRPEKKTNQKSLTPTLVKEIAETVKKVIIKDIRNELADIYFKTTETNTQVISTKIKTTTETPPTTTSMTTTQLKNMSIMEKVMDLYEEIKLLKQAAPVIKPNNASATFVNNVKPSEIPTKTVIYTPSVNELQIPEAKSISSIVSYNAKPIFNYNSYLPRKKTNRRIPITIQTNSVEIQPLAIPVSKPENLIRQNIIVHQRRVQGKADHLKHMRLTGYKYSDSDTPVKPKDMKYNYSPLQRYDGYNSARYPHYTFQEPKQRDDVIRFRVRDSGNSRLDTDYYEKINFGNDNHVRGKHASINNGNVPRFHERLERVDSGSDGLTVVSDFDTTGKQEQNGDVPSRHQLSLVDMKKGSSYDDTHFKNFIKTQQKVTDMLERILATRPKTNTPRSVETV